MKKILIATAIGLSVSTTAFAIDSTQCQGGKIYRGFCFSNVKLNWWSAYNWCATHGLRLAKIKEVCPEWNGKVETSSTGCPSLSEAVNEGGWTATASGAESALAFNFYSGYISTGTRYFGRADLVHAICTTK